MVECLLLNSSLFSLILAFLCFFLPFLSLNLFRLSLFRSFFNIQSFLFHILFSLSLLSLKFCHFSSFFSFPFLSLLSLFEKNRVGLWGHVAVCVSVYPPLSFLGNGSANIPLSLLGNGSVKIPLSLLGNGSVKIPLSLLDSGSVETLPR
jgi:hypothetical protein